MSLRTPLAALGAAALATAVAATPAIASKAPTKQEAAAITKAFKASPLVVHNKSWFTVDRIRISSRSSQWALAWQTATPAGEGKFQPAYAIFVRPDAPELKNRWMLVSLGTALVGCGTAPNAVIKDLVGGGCPPGEGV